MLLLKDGLHWFLVELYQACLYSWDDFWSRPVGSGAAWRGRYTKNLQGEIKKKGREGRKEREREREGRKWKEGEGRAREKDVLGLWV